MEGDRGECLFLVLVELSRFFVWAGFRIRFKVGTVGWLGLDWTEVDCLCLLGWLEFVVGRLAGRVACWIWGICFVAMYNVSEWVNEEHGWKRLGCNDNDSAWPAASID